MTPALEGGRVEVKTLPDSQLCWEGYEPVMNRALGPDEEI
jgi:hypothetical protein